MKRVTTLLLVLFLSCPLSVRGEDFLGAPLVPGARELTRTPGRLEMGTSMRHDQVLAYYKEALKGLPDIRYRDWKEATYIEDDGRRPWHSITISKRDETGASVVIVKDNWTWIIGTLVLRYIGVFVVLLVLFVGMALSGRLISSVVRKMEGKKGPTGGEATPKP